ncbi:nuclease-related domain-containing protein [Bacillus sp. S/N-304-OC-R1]|uniref:nuclease-related domain-containing protein n=1 Tax=Bacillus sp. S/N-304-OC-R1 TaxID=2758034 RepID=UPI001C8D9B5B|nr:nuclease-related domain-containing protein [Bacillus sp. S/N-304-OC-R1]MBY0123342.1 NERD domain-containing protein [Bacillus sp. S/N-304-OC-R1]
MSKKFREEPYELTLFRYLNVRTNLSDKEKNYYLSLEKGYEGELRFDEFTAQLAENWLIINDLMLEHNHAVFQIDTLFISSEKIIMFEVKNYEGDYVIKTERWSTLSNVEIRNPLHQLERNESLLRKVLLECGVTTPIEKYLIFINPDFYLYQAPLDLPIIFPTQLNRFIKQLSNSFKKVNETHLNLAKKLVAIHLKKSPYMRLPEYCYDQLKKGITCGCCYSFNVEIRSTQLVCTQCGWKERLADTVLRGVEEFSFLFPDHKVTTSEMMKWFKIINSKVTMRRLLSENFIQVGRGRYSYYTKK